MSEYPGDEREATERAERTDEMLRGLANGHERMKVAATTTMSLTHLDGPALTTVRLNVEELLLSLGEDIMREGLRETPARVAKFFAAHFFPEPVKLTTFKNEGMSEMVVQADIPFYSLCEHHMVPFFGTAVVAYIPNQRIVGLSKLARLVQYHAAGLQNQERITSHVATALEALEPLGIGVVLKARHLCMEMRGIKIAGAYTTTSDLRGTLREDARARAEFMSLAR